MSDHAEATSSGSSPPNVSLVLAQAGKCDPAFRRRTQHLEPLLPAALAQAVGRPQPERPPVPRARIDDIRLDHLDAVLEERAASCVQVAVSPHTPAPTEIDPSEQDSERAEVEEAVLDDRPRCEARQPRHENNQSAHRRSGSIGDHEDERQEEWGCKHRHAEERVGEQPSDWAATESLRAGRFTFTRFRSVHANEASRSTNPGSRTRASETADGGHLRCGYAVTVDKEEPLALIDTFADRLSDSHAKPLALQSLEPEVELDMDFGL